MGRILTIALVGSLVLTGAAWATDGDWAEDQVIKEDVMVEATEDFEQATPVDAGTIAVSPDRLGMYFGTGDSLAIDGAYVEAGAAGSPHSASTSAAAAHSHDGEFSYYDQPVYGPHTGSDHVHEGYSYDNVYGPLWGVPEEAVGLEGYEQGHYFLSGTADGQGQPVHTHETADSGSDDSGSGDSDDGINISSSEDY